MDLNPLLPHQLSLVTTSPDERRAQGLLARVAGRVVLMPAGNAAYKVVMSRDGEDCSDHAFGTMREAEAFIRRNVPAPAPRSTLYDRPGTAGVSHATKTQA